MPNSGAFGLPVSHKTVMLARGKHASPDQGVCVMELASMLAGEEFSDHPLSVCPVIGAFLRAYNDSVDDRRRHDLYGYAAKVVGTRSTVAVERERADMCRRWVRQIKLGSGAAKEPNRSARPPGRPRRWLQRARDELAAVRAGIVFAQTEVNYDGMSRADDERHRIALRLLDELTAVGGHGGVEPSHPRAARPRGVTARGRGSRTLISDPKGGPSAR